jgi:hypothetical protein
MAGPAEADEPAVDVVEIVEAFEEVHAGIDERGLTRLTRMSRAGASGFPASPTMKL